MNQMNEQISCPNCGAAIDVNQVLAHQLEERLRKEKESEIAEIRRGFQDQQTRLKAELEALEAAKKGLAETVESQVSERLKKQTALVQEEARKKAKEESDAALESMRKELREKSEQVQDLARTKADNERLQREKDELKVVFEAEAEKKANELVRAERERIQKAEGERMEMLMRESRLKEDSLARQVEELKRKLEQGSQQRQGEVQEIAIEEWLKENFPLDTIEEIKKGYLGGDCVQTVNTRERANCGTIYYESKRTKSFQPAWIEKFKADIRERRADIGVLVTEVMPQDMDRMGMREGIWICTFEEFKGLSAALRETLIRVSAVEATQVNRGSKMEMLYSYLTGLEFRQQLEAIVEGFTQMQQDLEGEKRAFQAQWKKREKQIDKVLLNTTSMYSSIRGIAGNAVEALPLLELPGSSQLDFHGEDI